MKAQDLRDLYAIFIIGDKEGTAESIEACNEIAAYAETLGWDWEAEKVFGNPTSQEILDYYVFPFIIKTVGANALLAND